MALARRSARQLCLSHLDPQGGSDGLDRAQARLVGFPARPLPNLSGYATVAIPVGRCKADDAWADTSAPCSQRRKPGGETRGVARDKGQETDGRGRGPE